MAYGAVKVDTIIFDNSGADQNVLVSGIYRALTSGVSVTGSITADVLLAATTITGTTITGSTVQGISGSFTSLTGTTTTGTTANFASGIFTTVVSGETITGTTVQGISGSFTSLTGTTTTGTTANFASGVFTTVVSGTTVTGTTANFASGIFTTIVSGATVTGTTVQGISGSFTSLTGTTTYATTIELGNASDTSLSRSSAGVLAVEGIAIPSISSASTLTNKTLVDPIITGTILEDVFTITDAAAFEVNPGNGSVQLITLGANRTPKATNFVAGESITLMVNDGTGFTLTWTDATWGSGGVKWIGSIAPTLALTGFTVLQFWKVSTQVYGAIVGNVA